MSMEKESVSHGGFCGTEVITVLLRILSYYKFGVISLFSLLCRRILLSVARTVKPAITRTWCKARSTEWWRGVTTGMGMSGGERTYERQEILLK